MSIVSKFAACIAVSTLVTGCVCRSRSVDPGNIPMAKEGTVIEDIHFAFDSSELSGDAKMKASNAADWMAAHPEKAVKVEGHCDERGTTEYNMVLGQNRARSVYDYLRSLGVAADRMTPVSYGEEFPLDPGHNEEAWAQNRRVHFDVE